MNNKLLVITNYIFSALFLVVLIIIFGAVAENVIRGGFYSLQDDWILIAFYFLLSFAFSTVYYYAGTNFRKKNKYSNRFIVCIGIIYFLFGILLTFLSILFGFITARDFYWNVLSILTLSIGMVHFFMILMLKNFWVKK
jgi:hypothetical protein